jgi:hypothetical protein
MITVYVLVTFADESGVHKAGTICQVKSEDFDPRFMKKIDNPGGDSYTKEETNELLSHKQNSLTPGQNITIEDDTISAKDDIGDSVEVTQIQSTGTKIATVKVNNTPTDLYAPASSGDTVSVEQVQTSGTKIATISVNSVPTDLYAPAGGGGGSAPTIAEIDILLGGSSASGDCHLAISNVNKTAYEIGQLLANGEVRIYDSQALLTYSINAYDVYDLGSSQAQTTINIVVWDTSEHKFCNYIITRDDSSAPGGDVKWTYTKDVTP